ncbi:peptide ABC transporter permease [Stutzerimonas kirkiae]|uniref:Peptide ABC transporter permease n=1 Tax=Stutzerimonas kirkiae TaxID=2211392 RepID=A0A4Q9REA6_9GAMM|nr:ABC transporter permease [Stutzerimonas kirkiae]TBU98963.1 peptide ABC transporter permease [Stutzerimonas kirkiae]TBV01613.1 peptide ABC transporter permease [Stutzerimonas kirkiae]TBV16927.1 peptide ABC transporter permease [Stutzerimonas kirkiae]
MSTGASFTLPERWRHWATRARALLGRLGQALFVLWAAFTLSFLILYALPSDPVSIMLNQNGEMNAADQAQVAALKARYHLDQPLPVQYAIALRQALQLDLGQSIQSGQAVTQALWQALPGTAALAAAALLLALPSGVGLALLASRMRGPRLHEGLLALPSLAVSLPTFWVGLLLLQWLSFRIPLFPAMGNQGLAALVLPALTLAIPTAAVIAQVLSRSIAGVLQQPFVSALRSKGVSHDRLLFGHVLHNAAIPLLTLAGGIVGNLLAGAVVTETVFSRDGIGRLAQGAVASQDIPMVQGVVLLAAAIYILVNLLVDALYPLLDPRIDLARRP